MSLNFGSGKAFERLQTPVWICDLSKRSVIWENSAARAYCNAIEFPSALSSLDLARSCDQPILTEGKVYRDGSFVTIPVTCRTLPRKDQVKLMLAEPALQRDEQSERRVAGSNAKQTGGVFSVFGADGVLLVESPASSKLYAEYGAHFNERFTEAGLWERILEGVASSHHATVRTEAQTNGTTSVRELSCEGGIDHRSGKQAIFIFERPQPYEAAVDGSVTKRMTKKCSVSPASEIGLLAQVSHEMRTSIGAIVGLANLIEEKVEGRDVKAMLREITEQGESLEKMTADILDVGRIERGEYQLDPAPFLPIDLVRRVEREFAEEAHSANVSLRLKTDSGVRNSRIGDSQRILQILQNIVGNAIKFSSDQDVLLDVRCEDPTGMNFEVRDTGVGMTSDQVARIFDRFVQADPSIQKRYGGSGLGMSIVKQLVDAMSGTIQVTSEPGVGTSVRVRLPIQCAETPMKPTDARPSVFKFNQELHALIVDDVPTNQLVLQSMLQMQEITADIVSSGFEALERVRTTQYDILLIDIAMPGMCGAETLARIREVERELGRVNAPAMAVTASAMPQQVEECLRAGFDAHMAKPVKLDHLSFCIKELVDASAASPQTSRSDKLRC